MQLICGILSFESNRLGGDLLTPMCDAMRSPHRPATVTTWTEGPAALAILNFAQQPQQTSLPQNAAITLAADIRLDNLEELRATLDQPNASQADIALSAYEKWGADAPFHLLGDFALAAFDRNGRTLTLARDIFGIRPITYYHQPGRYVVFASFARGLFPSGMVPREIDPLAIARQIQFRFSAEDTPFRNIRMVPPAHRLTFSRTGEHLQRYWLAQRHPIHHKTPESAARELRSLVDTAVRTRLPTTGPVAAHLSGGIDSSTICTFASLTLRDQPTPRPVHAFSFWPDDRPELNIDYERPYVEAVLAHDPNILLHPIPQEPKSDWLHAACYPDRIQSIAPNEPDNAVCRQAAALGADTILSGWGGDEGATFNGRGALAQALLTFRWQYLAQEMLALQTTRGWSKPRVFANEILPYIQPNALRRLKHRLRHGQRSFDDRWRDLLQPTLGQTLDAEKQDRQIWHGPRTHRNQLNLIRAGHLSWKATMWSTIGAHYGVAFTFPMLDRRLVNFALSLPAQWHIRDGFKRRPIRDAAEGILPEAVRWRHNKILPYPQFLVEIPEQREAILQRIAELTDLPEVRAIFRVEGIHALVESMPTPQQSRTTHRGPATQVLVNLLNVIQCCAFLEGNR